ncbi:MAG: hypothetical protein ACUVX8_10545 [Candidatus Zipacnadales bacterium]
MGFNDVWRDSPERERIGSKDNCAYQAKELSQALAGRGTILHIEWPVKPLCGVASEWPTMASILSLGLLTSVFSPAAAGELPQVAILCSDPPTATGSYRDEYDEILERLAWPYTKVPNTQFGELAKELDRFDIVLGTTGWNVSNCQDLRPYAEQLRRFVRYGGVLLLTDVNHEAHVGWLPAIEPRLTVQVCAQRCARCTEGAGWAHLRHPLLAGITTVPTVSFHPSRVSGLWQVLARNPCGAPTLAVRELGDGLIIATASARPDSFPDVTFLHNLWLWARDEIRIEQARAREEERYRALTEPKELRVRGIGTPVIDGLLDDEAWKAASQTLEFVLPDNSAVGEQETRAFVGQDDYWLYLAFRCHNNDLREVGEDRVEILLDPSGEGTLPRQLSLDSKGQRSGPEDLWWQSAVQRSWQGWTAEVGIALVSLGDIGGFRQDWLVNFSRYSGENGGSSVWAPSRGQQPGWGKLRSMGINVACFPIRLNHIELVEGRLSASFTKPSYGEFRGRYIVETTSSDGTKRETVREIRVGEYNSTLVETQHRFDVPGTWQLRARIEENGNPVWVSAPMSCEIK